ncbi:MAG: putative Ig domain-containing protein, partial [Acidobacteriota bacterium]
ANDYRTVDLPFPNSGEKITGDAWLGWYTTKDGGLTWRTRLLPGFPQDNSPIGLASPLKGYGAGADPIIRPGSNGLFYYGGLVFDRTQGGGSAIFVARFVDNNNQDGIDGEPIAYLGAAVVDRIGLPPVFARGVPGGADGSRVARADGDRTSQPGAGQAREGDRNRPSVAAGAEAQFNSQLVDKPWLAVDIPRSGAPSCTIGGPGTGVPQQVFPGGRVYMVYTLFDDPGEQRGRILFSRSTDCGATWSTPRVISRVPSADVNDDGVATTADVNLVRAAYRSVCGNPAYRANADINNDCVVDLYDLTFVSRGVGAPVPTQPLLSQGATIAINPQNGVLQIAWRQFQDGVAPNAIVTVRSTNGGTSFSAPLVVGGSGNLFDQGTTNTSFRTNAFPTLTFDGGGRAYLAWTARGHAVQRPDPLTGDARILMSTTTTGSAWTTPTPVDNQIDPGHQIMPALTFAQGTLNLVFYDLREDVSQLFGPFVDELPILIGPLPRVRHTIDVRGAVASPAANPLFASFPVSTYRSGVIPGFAGVHQLEFNPFNLPLFRAGSAPFGGDYIDTAAAVPIVPNGAGWSFNSSATSGAVFHAVWTDNRDVRPPADGDWTNYTAPNPPFTRPAMSAFDPSQLLPACVPGQAGMRNQNIYTARITTGLVVGALSNTRPLDGIPRSFPVFAQNNGSTTRSYRLEIASQPPGGYASFRQFDLLTTLDVSVPPRSTVARTVFAQSSDRYAPIAVTVSEITAPGGNVVQGGQQGTINLNPDRTTPDIENPDIESMRVATPDIQNSEVYNPDIESASTRNPDIESTGVPNPDIENPDIENVIVANPDILNPDIENPDIENPDIENPDIENPDIESADLTNGALTDTTWTVTNNGNAASAFTIRLALTKAIPPGFKSQLIAHKVYKTPTVLGCALLTQPQTVLLANVPNPQFVAAADLANPDIENPDIENVTLALLPGESARITLRVLDPNRFDTVTYSAAESVAPVAVAQAVGTEDAAVGVTQPAAAGVLTSDAPVPGSTVGGAYSTTVTSVGTGTWSLVSGSLPPGLSLDAATGVIDGTATTPGVYTFTLLFEATSGISDYRTMTITIGNAGASADLSVSALTSSEPVPVGANLVYTLNVFNAGPLAATNVVLTDTLPLGAKFVSVTASQGACQYGNGTLVCPLGTLPLGASATVVLTVTPTGSG